jgi:hypothetical protein
MSSISAFLPATLCEDQSPRSDTLGRLRSSLPADKESEEPAES